MNKNLIKVNLLPGYKEDKFVSNTIYRITLGVVFVFIVFYFMALPMINARRELESEEFRKTQLIYVQSYYTVKIAERQPNPKDVVYTEALEFAEVAVFPVNSWINQLIAIEVEGYILSSYEIDLDLEEMIIRFETSSDSSLLEFEEKLWQLYWVEGISYTTAGPGNVVMRVSFEVGDYIES